MPEENITTKFRVDISDLKRNITEANNQIKLANAQFKAAASGMDDWENSTEGLQAKIRQLNSVLEAQTSKLRSYEQQLSRLEEAQRENSRRADELRQAYQDAVSQWGAGSTQAQKYAKALESVEREAISNESAADKLRVTILNQQAAVNTTQRDLNNYTDELEQLEKGADGASDSVEDLSNAARDSGDGFTVMKGALADLISSGIQAAMDGLKDLAQTLLDLPNATREFRDSMNRLEAAFTTAGFSAEQAQGVYNDFYAVIGESDRAQEAVNHLAKLTSSQEELNDWTTIAAGVWATFGESLPIEGLTEAANETAKVGQVTGPLADALNWAGVNEDKFNESLATCNTEQERAQLITQTLTGLYSEAADSYYTLNGSIIEANEAQAEFDQTLADLGGRLEPVSTAIQTGLTDVLSALIAEIDGVDFNALADGIQSAFQGFIDNVLPVLLDGLQWIIDNGNTIAGVITAIGAGFAAFKITGLVTNLVSGFTTFFSTLKTGQGVMVALNAVMAANPIGLIVSAIAALVAGFIYLWNTSEEFRNFWLGLWDSIKTACQPVIDAIVNFFTVTIPQAFNTAVNAIVNFFTVTIPTAFQNGINAIGTFFTNIGTTITNFVTVTIPQFIQNVVTWFLQLPERIAYVIGLIVGHFIKWGQTLVDFVTNDIPQFFNNVVDWFSKLPGEIWNWLSDTISRIAEWASKIISQAKEAAQNFLQNVVNFFQQLPGRVWDFLSSVISNISNWASNIANQARTAASNFLNNVVSFFQQLPGKVSSFLSNVISHVTTFVSNMGSKALEAGRNFFNNLVNTISQLPSRMLQIGSDIVTGIWNGITSGWNWLVNQVQGLVNSFMNGVKSVLGINSPSKEFAWMGRMIDEGLAKGVNDNLNVVRSAVGNMTDALNVSPEVGVNGSAGTGGTGGRTVVFNQYNTSPKALNRLEIYRMTKNGLRVVGSV